MDGECLGIDPLIVGIALEDGIGQRDGAHVVEVGDHLGEVESHVVAALDAGVVPAIIQSSGADVLSADVGVVVNEGDVVGDDAVAVVCGGAEAEGSILRAGLEATVVDGVGSAAVAGEVAHLLAQQEADVLLAVVDLGEGQVEDCDGVEAVGAGDAGQRVARHAVDPLVVGGIVVQCTVRSVVAVLVGLAVDPGEVVADNLVLHADGIGTDQEVQQRGAVATHGVEAAGNGEGGVEEVATVAVSGVEHVVVTVVAVVGNDLVGAGGGVVDGQVEHVGARAAVSIDVVAGVDTALSLRDGVAVVNPGVAVASSLGEGLGRALVQGELQGVDTRAVAGVDIVVGDNHRVGGIGVIDVVHAGGLPDEVVALARLDGHDVGGVVDGQVEGDSAVATGGIGEGVLCGEVVDVIGVAIYPGHAVASNLLIDTVVAEVDGQMESVNARAAVGISVVVVVNRAAGVRGAVPCVAVAGYDGGVVAGVAVDGQVQCHDAVAAGGIGELMSQVVAAGSEAGMLIPVEAVAGHCRGVTRGAVLDSQVQRHHAVASGCIGEGVRQAVAAGGEAGVLVPVEAVASHGGGVAGVAVVDGQVQRHGAVAAVGGGEEVRQCAAAGGEAGVLVPVEAVASHGGGVTCDGKSLVHNQSTEPAVGTNGIEDVLAAGSGGGEVVSTPVNARLLGADVDGGGVVVVDEVDVVGYHTVTVLRLSTGEMDLALDDAVEAGSLLGGKVEGAVAQGQCLVAQQEVDIVGAGVTLGKDKLQDEGAVDSIVIADSSNRSLVDVLAADGLVESVVVCGRLFGVDEDVGLTVARPGVFLASHDDLGLVAGGTDKEVEGNHAVATGLRVDGGGQRTEVGRCVGLEEGVVGHVVGNIVELVVSLAANDGGVIAVAVIDSQVKDAVAGATVGIGEGDRDVVASSVGLTIPLIAVASNLCLLKARIYVDSEVEGVDTRAAVGVGVSAVVGAADSLGDGVAVVSPGVTVADGGSLAAVAVVVDGEVEVDDAVATGEALEDDAVNSTGGVGDVVDIPGVAVASGGGDSGRLGLADGQEEGIRAGASVGGNIVVGVFAAGIVGRTVPLIAGTSDGSAAAAGVVVDGEVEGVDARAVVGGEVVAVVGAALGRGEGVAVVVPSVGVAGGDSLAAVAVVEHGQLQGVGAGATVGVGIVIEILAAFGVGHAGGIPGVTVATVVDHNVVCRQVDGVADNGVVTHRVVVAVGVAQSLGDGESKTGLVRQCLRAEHDVIELGEVHPDGAVAAVDIGEGVVCLGIGGILDTVNPGVGIVRSNVNIGEGILVDDVVGGDDAVGAIL